MKLVTRHFLITWLTISEESPRIDLALQTAHGLPERSRWRRRISRLSRLSERCAPAFPHEPRSSGQTRGGRYCRARYYHARLQRFISEDPIGFAGGDPNLYAYVFNSPTTLRDPLGLAVDPVSLTALAIFCGGGAAINVATKYVLAGRKVTLGEAASAAAVGCGVGIVTLTAGIALGLTTATGAVVADVATTAESAIVITEKIRRQMGPRGWTEQLINEAIAKGQRIPAVNFATGSPATRYVHPETGQSVIVDDVTRAVIQVGAKGFRF